MPQLIRRSFHLLLLALLVWPAVGFAASRTTMGLLRNTQPQHSHDLATKRIPNGALKNDKTGLNPCT